MIRRLTLYLAKNVLTAFLFSSAAVAFVVLFSQTFYLLSFVIDNAATASIFLKLAGLTIPTFLPLIVPISFGIAVLFSYHKFAQDSEIVVMRATGLSPMRMAWPAFVCGAAIVFLGYWLTLWATPAANRSLAALQYQVRDNHTARMLRPGTFNDVAKGLTFYARRKSADGGMEDILVHDVRNAEFPVTIMAEKGTMTLENGAPRVVVFNGRRQELDVKTGRLRELGFKRYVVDLEILRANAENRALSVREMTTPFLWRAWKGLEKTPHAEGKIRAEIHQRFASPLLSLSFAHIAVAAVLVGAFDRRGAPRRVAGAAIAIVALQALMIGLSNQTAKQAWLAPVLYLTILVPVPLCLVALDAKSSLARRLRAVFFKETGP